MDALKILVVDDESRMRKLVKDFLTKKNFQVLEAGDGEEAMDIFYEEKDIALIILDVMMPKMDGWEVCREIRKNSKVPIIMLTARSDERDELLGFDLGVDEYISKPFSPKILVARVEAILRRTGQGSAEDVLSAGGIVIDKAAHLATVDGKTMDLSFKEFELLTYFLENEGIALSREKILNSVWNYDYFGDARTIDTHVKKLRSKMGDKGESPCATKVRLFLGRYNSYALKKTFWIFRRIVSRNTSTSTPRTLAARHRISSISSELLSVSRNNRSSGTVCIVSSG